MILRPKNNRGFTLLEVIISVTIFILVLGSIFIVFSFTVDKDRKLIESQQQLSSIRVVINQLSKEFKNAEINTFIKRDTTICPRINEIFKIGNNSSSISLILGNKCIRYKLGTYNKKGGVLLRDEEDAIDGEEILFDVPVLNPSIEVGALSFFISGINRHSITTSILVGGVNESLSKVFNYQFTIKNNKNFSLKNKYEVKRDNDGLGINGSFCKVLADKKYIYAIYQNSAVEVYDLEDLNLVGSLSGSISMSKVIDAVIYNDFLIVFGLDSAGNEGWYRVINMSPIDFGKSPVQVVGGSGLASIANFLALKDNYLYISRASDGFIKGGIDIYSISSDGDLNLENSFIDTNNYSGHLHVFDDYLYEESWGDDDIKRNLKEYNISSSSNPLLVDIYQDVDPGSMTIKDGFLYTSGDGFNIYRVSNIGAGKLNRGKVDLGGYGYNMQLVGPDIFLSNGREKKVFYENSCDNFNTSYVINASDPLNPFVSNSYKGGLDVVRVPYVYRKGVNNIEILKLFEINNIIDL